MFYQHKDFTLDTNARSVVDENGKELRLTGNAYRVLVFLCANGSATLTQLGEYLDHAKEYDENHLRQYRYRINSIIGKDVVIYKNGVYLLVGKAEEDSEMPAESRNTHLLQAGALSLSNETNKPQIMPLPVKPSIIAAILLILTFIDWPYAYYTLLRVVITAIAIYYAYSVYKGSELRGFWWWSFIAVAIVFNPIVPVYLYDKSAWSIIDVAAAIIIILSVKKLNHQYQSTA